MVMELYDLMVLIWGAASSTEPLSFGDHSAGQAEESQGGVDTSGNSGNLSSYQVGLLVCIVL